jgi:hypothetical protein
MLVTQSVQLLMQLCGSSGPAQFSVGTRMNPKTYPWTVGRGLVGDKRAFYYSFQNFGSWRANKSIMYLSRVFLIRECE